MAKPENYLNNKNVLGSKTKQVENIRATASAVVGCVASWATPITCVTLPQPWCFHEIRKCFVEKYARAKFEIKLI